MPVRPAFRNFCWALALLFLAGCSNDPNPKPYHADRPDGTPWVVRYWYMPDEPRSLDPQFAYEETSRRVLEPVYDTLLQYNPFKTDPYEVEPDLLAAMPAPAPGANGQVEYLCHLKPGVLFHDDPCFPGGLGREVVSSDVLFAIQRMCDPKVESPVLSALAEYLPGMQEASDAAKKNGGIFAYDRPLPCFEQVDSHTFKLHLSKPYPQILWWMAMHFFSPVAREAVTYYDGLPHLDGPHGEKVQRPEFRWHPVGHGPFVLAEYTPGQRVRLIRNPHYTATSFPQGGWPAAQEAQLRPLAGRPMPILDEVQISIFRESMPIWILARQGYLDGMGIGKDAFNSVVTPLKELSPKYRARGMTLEKLVEPSTFFLSFNMEDPVLGPNQKLRQALSCAFDRQSFIDIFYNGVPTVAEQLIPPGVAGFRQELRNPYGFNLEKGHRLLAEAGYPKGIDPRTGAPLEITLDVVASGGEERQMAEFEQRELEQLGIRVRVIENNFPRMLEKEDKGAFQIASGSGWMADYPDAENFFFLFYSKNFPPDGKNTSRYKNPEFDRQFEQMAAMESSPARLQIIDQMNRELLEDCPVLLSFNKAGYALEQPWARPTHRNLMLEGGLKYSTLDPVVRAEKRREWNAQPLWPLALLLGTVVAAGGYGVSWIRRRNV